MKQRILVSLFLICSLCVCVATFAQTSTTPGTKTKASRSNAPSSNATSSDAASSEGEKRFQVNCGRCHNPPEELPPAATRAVVRHMRVRAMLSAEDEKLILEFLNP
jgi:cytochrome c5